MLFINEMTMNKMNGVMKMKIKMKKKSKNTKKLLMCHMLQNKKVFTQRIEQNGCQF